MVEKLVSDSFMKNRNWTYPWINTLSCYKNWFYYISRPMCTKIYLKPRWWPFVFTLYKHFFLKKIERDLKLVSLPHFLHDFWRKILLRIYFAHWPKFISSWLLLLNILGNICIVIYDCSACNVINLYYYHCILLSCHVWVSEWIHTL